MNDKPRLFGIDRSNRDYTLADTWGKNQFNSSFPASLACYLHSKGMKAVYYKTKQDMKNDIHYIGIDELYGVDPLGNDMVFKDLDFIWCVHLIIGIRQLISTIKIL